MTVFEGVSLDFEGLGLEGGSGWTDLGIVVTKLDSSGRIGGLTVLEVVVNQLNLLQ